MRAFTEVAQRGARDGGPGFEQALKDDGLTVADDGREVTIPAQLTSGSSEFSVRATVAIGVRPIAGPTAATHRLGLERISSAEASRYSRASVIRPSSRCRRRVTRTALRSRRSWETSSRVPS